MKWADLCLRLRALRSRQRVEDEMDEELSFHLEMEGRKNRARGLPHQRAHVDFGGLEQVREECRDMRGTTFIDNLWRDLKYGARMLRKSPAFTTVAMLSLAIGVGANTAVFTLVDAVLLRSLPVSHPEQLVVMQWGARKAPTISASFSSSGPEKGWSTNVVTWQEFTQIRDHSHAIENAFGFSQAPGLNVSANGQALITGGLLVTGNYFQSLGVGMAAGRALDNDDDHANGMLAAVISYGAWDRIFALDPNAIGKSITINGELCTVVGVTPKGFYGVSAGGFWRAPRVDLMLPIRAREVFGGFGSQRVKWFGDELHWIQVMGRLPGASARGRAESELSSLLMANAPERARRTMEGNPPRVKLLDGSQGLAMLREQYKKPLLILFTVVALTLLMACTNLAGLLLARATARQKEIMIRLATGARRSRLIGQLMVEGALLALFGAALGSAFAYWGVAGLLQLVSTGPHPMLLEVSPDLRILAFTALITGLTTFLFALAPAIRATRVDVAHGLKIDSAGTGGGRFGTIRVLVAAQIAVALLLLCGARLFERTLSNLRSVNLGFNAQNLVVFDVAPGRNGYNQERSMQLYERMLGRLRQSAGVSGVTVALQRLVDGAVSSGNFEVEGAADKSSNAYCNFVGPDFAHVMQMRVIAGRDIDSRDMTPSPRVALVNETAARQYFGEMAVGKRFRWNDKDEWDVEVVGVLKDAVYDTVRRVPPPTVFAPYTQWPVGWAQQMSVEVRTAGSPSAAIANIRRAMADIDRNLPLANLKTMETQIDDTLAQERLFVWLVSLFGMIALALASIGLYGLVASSVASRTREIGIRMALGAGRGAVLRLVLGQVALTAGAGLVVGVPTTLALTKVIQSQLFGVKPHDVAAVAAAGAGVLAMALVAAWWPARRAVRIDPLRALRWE